MISIYRYILLLILTCLLSLSISLSSSYAQTVRVGVFEVEPFSYSLSEGGYGGLGIDVLKHIAGQEGWQLEFVPGTLNEVFSMLKSGEVDITAVLTYSPERAKYYDFTRETLFSDWGVVYSESSLDVRTVMELEGKRVAMLKGSFLNKFFMKLLEDFNVTIVPVFVDDYISVFRYVEEGKADALVLNRAYALQYARDYSVSKTNIIFSPIDIRMAVSKGKDPALLRALDAGFERLILDKNSLYYYLIDEMFGVGKKHLIPKWVWICLVVAVALFMLSSFLILLFKSQLKKRTRELELANHELKIKVAERVEAQRVLQRTTAQYRSLVESTEAVHWELDLDTRKFMYMGPQAQEMFGYTMDEWETFQQWSEKLHEDDRQWVTELCLELSRRGEDHDFTYRMITYEGKVVWVRDVVNVVTEEGKSTRLQGILFDVTEFRNAEDAVKQSLIEKETLIKEIHHRVKNNMQIISSLLNLQKRHIEDEKMMAMFEDSKNRIQSMALVHEMLYNSKNFAQVNVSEYVRTLVEKLSYSYSEDDKIAVMQVSVSGVSLTLDSLIPCGMIINELVTNALKYAYDDKASGTIFINLTQDDDKCVRLEVSDKGVGLPENFDVHNSKTLGLLIVNSLITQLEGELVVDSSSGTKFIITFTEFVAS